MRFVTPFILLYLNRDDDAFDFIRYWEKADFMRGEESIAELLRRHARSREGEWLYPREKNCRFLDFFEECPAANDKDVPLAFLVALLIIKLRLDAGYDATCQSIDLAFATTGGEHIQEVQVAVREMLIDSSVVDIDRQRQQVERLVNVIHRNNPSMLPSILDPLPLLERRPQSNIQGDPSDVYDTLNYCNRCFVRVPGAQLMLEQRFGERPSYNAHMQPTNLG